MPKTSRKRTPEQTKKMMARLLMRGIIHPSKKLWDLYRKDVLDMVLYAYCQDIHIPASTLRNYEKAVLGLTPDWGGSAYGKYEKSNAEKAAALVKGDTRCLSRMFGQFNAPPLYHHDPLKKGYSRYEDAIKKDIHDVRNEKMTEGPSSALRKLKAIPNAWEFVWALRLSVGATTDFVLSDKEVWKFLKLKYSHNARDDYKGYNDTFIQIWRWILEVRMGGSLMRARAAEEKIQEIIQGRRRFRKSARSAPPAEAS